MENTTDTPREARLKERIIQLMEERDLLYETVKNMNNFNTRADSKPDCDSCDHMRIIESLEEKLIRADSKPEYKYATEEELQEAKGWYTGEFQEAITFAFNAGRERKD